MTDSLRDFRSCSYAWFDRRFLKLPLTWKAKLVYMVLAAYASGKDESCFPSKGSISKLASVGKTVVYQALQELRNVNLIAIETRTDGARQTTNVYTLLDFPGGDPVRNTNGDRSQYEPSPVRNTNARNYQNKELSEFNALGELKNNSPRSNQASPSKKRKKKKAQNANESNGTDPRHKPCIGALEKYWDWMNSENKDHPAMPIGGRMVKVLSVFLADNRKMTLEQFQECLNNRAHSEGISPTDDPMDWIPHLIKFHAGPLDRFGKLRPQSESTDD